MWPGWGCHRPLGWAWSAQGEPWDGVRQGCLSVPRIPGSTGIVITQKHEMRPGAISVNYNAWSLGDWGFQNVLE